MGGQVAVRSHQARVTRHASCVTRVGDWLTLHLVPPLGTWAIRLIGWTLRLRTDGAEHVEALYRGGERVIIAFWHARQFMMPLAYRGTLAYVLVSRHRDGELISRIIERFGFKAVRGSTTRGGVEALRQLIRLGRSGVDLVVTPDGPRGPRQVVQKGVVQLAKTTGLPIVPLAFSCSKKKLFVSWDRFLLPYPFSRALFRWGPPIRVPREVNEAELEAKRLEVEEVLNRLTAQADEDVLRQSWKSPQGPGNWFATHDE